jgi:hypothetical protein
MLRVLRLVNAKWRCHEGATFDASSNTGVLGSRFGISLRPEQIHGAVAADADLRMVAPVDTRRARQLDIPGYGR